MTSIKKWIARDAGTGPYNNAYYMLKERAVEHAKRSLLSGEKKVVHIGRFSEAKYKRNERDWYVDVETWELVNGVPKRVRRS
jgi:hypothetical protein